MRKITGKQSYNVIPFIKQYPHISVQDLENILESLSDMGYISEKGKDFKTAFWRLFIKVRKS